MIKRLKFLLISAVLLIMGCKTDVVPIEKKIHGISLVASKDSLLLPEALKIKNIHANYVSLMPFAFLKNINHPEIVYNNDKQWFGETSAGIKQHKELLDSLHIKVLLKPQLWVWKGQFTGHIKMDGEAQWIALEEQYRNYILHFAKLAELLHIDVFCIGTELHEFVINRPEFFKKLIQQIRNLYHGKLTYAENWDVYQEVPFWGELDYIGIDAYFPVSNEKTPSLKTLKEGWKPYKQAMEEFAADIQKPIIFTEYGYRSIDFAGKEPWNHEPSNLPANYQAQNNCLMALYQTIWNEPWFAGGFLWKWFPKGAAHVSNQNRFTIQNKPAQELVKNSMVPK
ncbi:glycoside hydrolase [Galbibacter sp. PAP.153]|uniref:glycoside hydrolase family 113 n=1 Tax=Galbibacter sp. PAP.153 TaxID=3104623 RepID=UPI0030095907